MASVFAYQFAVLGLCAPTKIYLLAGGDEQKAFLSTSSLEPGITYVRAGTRPAAASFSFSDQLKPGEL
jgi:hypothetical protein